MCLRKNRNLVTVEFCLPDDIYQQATAILAKQGYTLEEACILFLEETVRRGDLPFPYTQKDIEEAKKISHMPDKEDNWS